MQYGSRLPFFEIKGKRKILRKKIVVELSDDTISEENEIFEEDEKLFEMNEPNDLTSKLENERIVMRM